jgi:xanthine dehydrogenase accessory factor
MNGSMRDWLPTLAQFLRRESVVVRIVVAEVRGSAPREPGTCMLVGHRAVEGSIGGGRLEWESVAAARALLEDTHVCAQMSKVVLGADLGQCCGGVVSVWLERFTTADLGLIDMACDIGVRGHAVLISTIKGSGVARRIATRVGVDEPTDRLLRAPRLRASPCVVRNVSGELTFLERLDDELPALWLYGAGHVGQALARILMELPLRLTWIDSRAELFPTTIAAGVRVLNDSDPVTSVSAAPVGAHFLVMTHSHTLDYDLCHAVLRRNDIASLGLIGSMSKAARFRSRLARDGLGAEAIDSLVCPIGIDGIASKWPAAIAVGVAAQLMQRISATPAPSQSMETLFADMPVRSEVPCASESCASCGSSASAAALATASPAPPPRGWRP